MKKVSVAIASLMLIAVLSVSCREQKSTGEKVEDAVEDIGDDIEDAVDDN